MNLRTLPVGLLQANCYVLTDDDGRVYIVDPGGDPEVIQAEIDPTKAKPVAILLTHGHFDHIGAVPELVRTYNIPVLLNSQDHELYRSPMNTMPPIPVVSDLPAPVTSLDAALTDCFEVIDLPGHSPGSVAYHLPKAGILLAGDTLFRESVGRTDLPGGDWATMLDSIKRLMTMPGELRVFPGHGPETTIDHERRSNPFLSNIIS